MSKTMKLPNLLTTILLLLASLPLTAHADEAQNAADANNAFGFALAEKLFEPTDNAAFSPYSISSALGIAAQGAKGETQSQMLRAMKLTKADTAFSDAGKLSFELQKATEADITLRVANALWVQEGRKLLDTFLASSKNFFAGELKSADFQNKTEEERVTINHWVEKKTENKITDLLPVGSISKQTLLVIVNAVYFYAKWLRPFTAEHTTEGDFQTPDKTVKAKFMRQTAGFRYYENEEAQLLELPYLGSSFGMDVLLPKDKNKPLRSFLDSSKFGTWVNELEDKKVRVELPKFKLQTGYFLTKALNALGMRSAFDSTADFSNIDGTKDLMISEVIHKAYVDVDEQGTEAAAATAVVMVGKAAMIPSEQPPLFRADHPFLFAIRETKTGAILFLGQVTDPTR